MPTVSVLMPTYNTNEEHLRAAVESILGQTWTDFEFLILDDASTAPHVRKVLESYNDERIKLTFSEKNLGISGARNKLLDMAQGKYLAVMDHDDISLPDRFARQVGFLESNPDVGVVGSRTKYFPGGKIKRYPLTNREIENTLMYGCVIEHPAAMIRKSVLADNSIRYEEEYTPAEDYVLFCRLLEKTKFANLPEILLHYRSHATNTSRTLSKKMTVSDRAATILVRTSYPDIWERAQQEVVILQIHKLFGALPVLITKKQGTKTKYMLFGFIPVLTVINTGRRIRRYLFGCIPLLHSKRREKIW